MTSPVLTTVFEEVVATMEPTLKSVAPFVLRRLLLRAGVLNRTTMSTTEFRNAMPVIEAGLRESLKPNELIEVMTRLNTLLERPQ